MGDLRPDGNGVRHPTMVAHIATTCQTSRPTGAR